MEIIDYLLKPFSFIRFLKAVNKVVLDFEKNRTFSSGEIVSKRSIFIKEGKTYHQVDCDEIVFLEAKGNYVKVQTRSTSILTYTTLSHLMKQLPPDDFIQSHKSFVIAISKVKSIEGRQIKLEEHQIPIGQLYKKNLLNRLKL